MNAVISACEHYRYRLDRVVSIFAGPVYAYFGVNGSTATADTDDHTVRKWIGFTKCLGGSRFIVGNRFGFRATDVNELAHQADPFGPDNDLFLNEIIAEADILVPCWGSRDKVPPRLRPYFDELMERLLATRKPVKHFGLTKSGDPKHPLTLGYDTPLTNWERASP